MLIALDFDGTLAPIVPLPEQAMLPAETRVAIETLADRRDTRVAVVSGRGLEDVTRRVGISGLYYAGNHGLEIRGPGLERRHEAAIAARPALEECSRRLVHRLAGARGVIVEDKALSLSVHYRLVADPTEADAIRSFVFESCGDLPGLRITEGKKVLEVRPAVTWHKGEALRFLVETLMNVPGAPVLFIGDDATDEDGFRAVGVNGAGIIVADPVPAGTAAGFYLTGPDQVTDLLRRLGEDA